MAKLTIDSTIKLRSGLLFPRLGFGVYQSTAAAASTAAALEAGYRPSSRHRVTELTKLRFGD